MKSTRLLFESNKDDIPTNVIEYNIRILTSEIERKTFNQKI